MEVELPLQSVSNVLDNGLAVIAKQAENEKWQDSGLGSTDFLDTIPSTMNPPSQSSYHSGRVENQDFIDVVDEMYNSDITESESVSNVSNCYGPNLQPKSRFFGKSKRLKRVDDLYKNFIAKKLWIK